MKIKCKICESEFIPTIDEHYISRDIAETGISTIIRKLENTIYDTFDCPICGCQVVVQERKRSVADDFIEKEYEGEYEDD